MSQPMKGCFLEKRVQIALTCILLWNLYLFGVKSLLGVKEATLEQVIVAE